MLELFLPRRCIHCKEPAKRSADKLSAYLCHNCHRAYDFLEPPDPEEIDDRRQLLAKLPYPVGIYAAHSFIPESVIQSIIHHIKYHDMPRLAKKVGNEVAEIFIQLANFTDVIIPVPLHRTRYAERGFNQSEVLAKQLAKKFGKALDRRSLQRTRPTPSQTGLSFQEREENVKGAFRLTAHGRSILKKKRVLVVDDVITTGATMASIGTELVKAEPSEVGFFALAAAQFNT